MPYRIKDGIEPSTFCHPRRHSTVELHYSFCGKA
nr:MAG TPA: hypothetical protein [Bacteriophage sp.]